VIYASHEFMSYVSFTATGGTAFSSVDITNAPALFVPVVTNTFVPFTNVMPSVAANVLSP
jgi:hypothetical protein